MSAAKAVVSQPHLGFDGAATWSAYQQPHMEEMAWAAHGPSSEGFRACQTQRGFAGPSRGKFLPPNSETTQWDRYGAVGEGFRGRRPTVWDNPAHRVDDHAGRLAPTWETAWGRHEGGRYSDPPRRIDASERLAAIAKPPPRLDPYPPDTDWQMGREESGRQRAVLTPAVASIPRLGFGGDSSIRGPQHDSEGYDEETLLDDDEEVESIEEGKKVVAFLKAARITTHDVVENCLSENCGAYLCALVGYKVAPSFPMHLKESAFSGGDLHVGDPTRLNPRSTSLDTDARLIPPRNDTSGLSILGCVDKLFVLGWNSADHIGYPLRIGDGGDEGRRSAIRRMFDPGGDSSMKRSLSTLFVAS